MRISVREDDPGHDPNAIGNYKAFLNGVDVTHKCVMADEEAGECVCLVFDELGKAQLNDKRDEVLTETLHGVVQIIRK